jgi:cytochrome oxidase Cu insertion factor (SCO1/SenC/PrrC family)
MAIARSPRVALLVIAAMFILPLALAWLMYTGTIEFTPSSTRNLGELVEPPQPLAWEDLSFETTGAGADSGPDSDPDLADHWTVLFTVPGQCEQECVRTVTDLRQVHRALGRLQDRVRLVLLLEAAMGRTSPAELRDIYPVFRLARDDRRKASDTLEAAAARSGHPGPRSGSAYLVDPLGNIMMFYPAGYDPNQRKQDLKRLLKWSKLDQQ